jgi:hypothetical protein
VHYLDTIGVQRALYSVPPHAAVSGASPAEALLYDLSGTAQLAGATANSFPLTEPAIVLAQRWP